MPYICGMDYTIDKPLSLKIRKALKHKRFTVRLNHNWYFFQYDGDAQVRFINVCNSKNSFYRDIKIEVTLFCNQPSFGRHSHYVKKSIKKSIRYSKEFDKLILSYLCHFGIKHQYVKYIDFKFAKPELS